MASYPLVGFLGIWFRSIGGNHAQLQKMKIRAAAPLNAIDRPLKSLEKLASFC